MAIFSFNFQELTGTRNNLDCVRRVGLEPANFAFLTTNGFSQFLADPLSSSPNPLFATVPGQLFKMNPGDKVRVTIRDTPGGLRAVLHDLTSGTTGSMTASIANGFAQVNFVPDRTRRILLSPVLPLLMLFVRSSPPPASIRGRCGRRTPLTSHFPMKLDITSFAVQSIAKAADASGQVQRSRRFRRR